MPNKLWFRLLIGTCAILAMTLIAVVLLVNKALTASFQDYVDDQQSARLQRAESILSRYYDRRREWAGVDATVQSVADLMGERLLLADAQGHVVADSMNRLAGHRARDDWQGKRISIRSQEFAVGTLYINPFTVGQKAADPRAELFLSTLNGYLSWAAIAGLLAALALSLGVARWLASPLEVLTRAVRRLERGDLDQRIDTSVGGEVGDLAEAFNSLAASLARVERLRQNMVSDIAHELRTPLSSIRGYLEAIQDGVVEANQQTLDTIHGELMQLTRLVDDLQELSLAEAHQIALHFEEVDLRELAEWEVRAFLPEAAAHEVDLVVAPSPTTSPVLLWLDPGRMRQVIGNIVRNAIAYTPAGGRIVVAVAPAGANVVLTIEDSGAGISPEDVDHIFERFYRADRARSRRAGGTGLGLTIARELVRVHGGAISAESQMGKGTRFTIRLPRRAAPPDVSTVADRDPVGQSTGQPRRLAPLVIHAAMVGALFGSVAGVVESWMSSMFVRKAQRFMDLFGYAVLIDAMVFAGLAALATAVSALLARSAGKNLTFTQVTTASILSGSIMVGLLAGYRWNQTFNRESTFDSPEVVYPMAIIVCASVLVAVIASLAAAAARQRWHRHTYLAARRALPVILVMILTAAGVLVSRDQVTNRLAAASASSAFAMRENTPRSPASRPSTEVAAAPTTPLTPESPVARMPNVVLVTVSSLRADHLGVYGYEKARTPTMDRLARTGARFANTLTAQPDKNAAHAAILTGTFASVNGVRTDMADRLDHTAPTLAEELAERGYRTAAIYSWVSLEPGYSGLDRGFHDYLDLTINRPDFLSDDRGQALAATYERLRTHLAVPGAFQDAFSLAGGVEEALDGKADVTTEAAIAWLEANKNSPFFLWVHYLDPHYPYSPPAPFDDVEDTGCDESCPDGTWSTVREIESGAQFAAAQINHLVGLYDGEVAFTDQQIGRLMARLEHLGLTDNTMVVLTADHGQSFSEHDRWFSGSSVYNSEARVPLIVSLPGRIPSGSVVAAPAMAVDLAPTVLDTIGLDVPDRFEGQSLLPLILGHSSGDDRIAIVELGDRSQIAVSDRAWKLIWSDDDQQARLYYLPSDPNELNDRSAEEPEIAARLLTALAEWRASHPN